GIRAGAHRRVPLATTSNNDWIRIVADETDAPCRCAVARRRARGCTVPAGGRSPAGTADVRAAFGQRAPCLAEGGRGQGRRGQFVRIARAGARVDTRDVAAPAEETAR